ncbi:Hypothetical protein SMAX5B_021273 [Scophthalmus maximus]|uniref:Uncharacterized protein n=1 Tax=Scophthalmus maximus TaxID=52904 RepID=A0A2U9BW95_SCOMX|nr:Hypothetical protein SMAX5B_021273 [Scophthalmus maximus]
MSSGPTILLVRVARGTIIADGRPESLKMIEEILVTVDFLARPSVLLIYVPPLRRQRLHRAREVKGYSMYIHGGKSEGSNSTINTKHDPRCPFTKLTVPRSGDYLKSVQMSEDSDRSNHFFSIMTVGREAEAEKEGTKKRPSPRDNDRRVVLEFKVKLYPDDYPIRRQSQEILIPAK